MDIYDIKNLPILEESVKKQASNGEYDFEGNKSLLKLYSCYPDSLNIDILLMALILSMMRLPYTDYLAMSCLVPRKLKNDDKFKYLSSCVTLLEGGAFEEFWTKYNSNKPFFNSINNFENAIRSFVMSNVRSTYSIIDKPKLQSLLGLNSNDIDNYLKSSSDVNMSDSTDTSIAMQKSSTRQQLNANYEDYLQASDVFGLLREVKSAELASKIAQF